VEHYQKIAVFGGVYNNYLALKQLLQECTKLGVDTIFCLGDMGGFGPHPDRCFPLLRGGNIRSISGNYDISLAEGREDCACGYTDPQDNHFAQISYNYTFENTSEENKAWLRTLPRSYRFSLGPLKVLLCHGSPRKTNEFLWESTSPDHLLSSFCKDHEANLICCSHTGIKWHRVLPQKQHFFNVGVIGRPENSGQTNVWFLLIEYMNEKLNFNFCPLEYDHDRLAREMIQEKLPEEFIATVQTGWWTTCMEIMPAKERLRGQF